MTLETIIYRDDEEVEVTCELCYHSSHQGARDSLMGVRNAGPPLEEDEPAHWELESCKDADGNDVKLSPFEEQRVFEKAWSYLDNK